LILLISAFGLRPESFLPTGFCLHAPKLETDCYKQMATELQFGEFNRRPGLLFSKAGRASDSNRDQQKKSEFCSRRLKD